MLQCVACLTRYSDGTQACPLDGGSLQQVAAAGDYAGGITPHLLAAKTIGRSTAAECDDDPLVGEILGGKLKVERQIGQGGMGTVYAAQHLQLPRRVAVKVLNSQLAAAQDLVARLHSEARLAAAISSPHIVEVFDVGVTRDGRPYVEMELLVGESLAQRLARCSALSETDTLAIVRQLAEALSAAHHSGILHRDIKPENIFLCSRDDADFVKLLDFGIAKVVRTVDEPRLTRTGAVLGTPLYMSPEQVRGDPLDTRADIYGLGVVFYECLTGSVPHCAASYLSVVAKILTEDAERPSLRCPDRQISPGLEAIVMKSMARQQTQRYSTMDELLHDLIRFRSGEPVLAFPHQDTSAPSPVVTWPSGWRLVLAAGALAALLLSLRFYAQPGVSSVEKSAAPNRDGLPLVRPALKTEPTIPLLSLPEATLVPEKPDSAKRTAASKKAAPTVRFAIETDPLRDEQAPNPFLDTEAPSNSKKTRDRAEQPREARKAGSGARD